MGGGPIQSLEDLLIEMEAMVEANGGPIGI